MVISVESSYGMEVACKEMSPGDVFELVMKTEYEEFTVKATCKNDRSRDNFSQAPNETDDAFTTFIDWGSIS